MGDTFPGQKSSTGVQPGTDVQADAAPQPGAEPQRAAPQPEGTAQVPSSIDEAIQERTARAVASRRRLHRTVAAVVLVLLLVAGSGAFVYGKLFGGQGAYFDQNAQAGQAPYRSAEEAQKEVDQKVAEGMFNISIASVIEMDPATNTGIAYIENTAANRYDMKVSIVLDSTGEQVYQSDALAPGNYIESINLQRDLGPGKHSATALFSALDQTTRSEIGQAGAKVVLMVGT